MDQTDRNMSALTVQDIVNNEGPVQEGTGSNVNSPVYSNCSIHHHHYYHLSPYHPAPHNDYLRWVEQNAAALGPGPSHSGLPSCPVPPEWSRNEDTTYRKTFHYSHHHGDSSSSYHLPRYCPDCLHYHRNNHQPLDEYPRPPQPRHSQLPHHAVHQLLSCPQHCISELTDRRVTSASGRDPQLWDVIQDNVCIMDSAGQALEPGDAVAIGIGNSTKMAIYVGNQHVVTCLREDNMVVKQKLEMTTPFWKYKVIRGKCEVYPARQRVDRATAKIGRKFKVGEVWNGSDFPYWIFTGLGWFKIREKGFRLKLD